VLLKLNKANFYELKKEAINDHMEWLKKAEGLGWRKSKVVKGVLFFNCITSEA